MPSDSERWVQVSVSADSDAADDLARILSANCPGGAAVEESASPAPEAAGCVTVKGWIPAADTETRRKLEIALLLLSRDGSVSEPIFQELAFEDWSSSWKEHFHPLRIGHQTVVVPSWCDFQPEPGDMALTLDPGMAFGTGLHATTRLCLRALEEHPPRGQRVLDVGCGSGILSIASALHGATHVDAIDNDRLAVTATRENVTRNQVADLVSVAWATLAQPSPSTTPVHKETGYDMVLANTLAEVIIGMAPALARATRQGGIVVLSGILEDKAHAVTERVEAEGIDVIETTTEGEWVALLGRRN
ncbi:MAG: 50S ribosomal protein L11 methyltransferase [Anaerolineae bacterium]